MVSGGRVGGRQPGKESNERFVEEGLEAAAVGAEPLQPPESEQAMEMRGQSEGHVDLVVGLEETGLHAGSRHAGEEAKVPALGPEAVGIAARGAEWGEEQELVVVRVIEREAARGDEPGEETLHGLLSPLHRGEIVPEEGRDLSDHVAEQLVLVGEVPVERGGGDARALGDGAHRDRRDTLVVEHREGGIERSLPCGLGSGRRAHDGKMVRGAPHSHPLHTGFTRWSSAPVVGEFAP